MAKRRAKGQGTLTKVKSGRHQGKWRLVYGNVDRLFKNQAEAQEVFDDLKRQQFGGVDLSQKTFNVADWLNAWMQNRVESSREPKTIAFYKGNVERHLIPHLGKIKLSDLTPAHVDRVLKLKAKAGLSKSTLGGIRATLRAALSYAVRNGHVGRNAAALAELPKAPAPKRRGVYSAQEQAKLLACLEEKPEAGLVLAFLLGTGCRLGEALGITVDRVHTADRMVLIDRQLQRLKGVGLELKPVKTKEPRWVPLAGEAWEAVQSAIAARVFAPHPMGLLFLNTENKAWDEKTLRDHFALICKKAGVPYLSPHHLRHTFATDLIPTLGLHGTQKVLGHSQVALTSNLYGHANVGALSEAMQRASEDRAVRRKQAMEGEERP